MNYAPIALFVYNRPWHTQQTSEALQKNELAKETELFIFSDAPKNDAAIHSVNEVRAFIKTLQGFKKVTIIEREKNWGLANSIIDGVTAIVNQYGKVIVLEDDLVTSPCFLNYMNHNLDLYQNDDQVASIHGYVYPINGLPETFFIRGADCWGWATWKRAWDVFEADGNKLLTQLYDKSLQKEADFNNSYAYTQMLEHQVKGLNDSWAIRWYISAFLNDMLTLYPGQSYVHNIGNDDSGTHCSKTDLFSTVLTQQNIGNMNKNHICEDNLARLKFELFFKSTKPDLLSRIVSKIRFFYAHYAYMA